MKFPSREEQKRILLQWEETGRELERIKKKKPPARLAAGASNLPESSENPC